MLTVDHVEYVHIVTPTSSLVLGSSICSREIIAEKGNYLLW